MQPPEHPSDSEKRGPGIVRDVKQIRIHGQATAAELREFLAQTRGRNPQEVLGLIAGSPLTKSICVAAVGVALLLVIGTIVPWLLKDTSSNSKPVTSPAAISTETNNTAQTDTTPTADPAQINSTQPSAADAKKAVEIMGLGDTKMADPKSNPMEKNLDNLLDDMD